MRRVVWLLVLGLVLSQNAGCPYVVDATRPGAEVVTTAGSFTFVFDTEQAPASAAGFTGLVESGFHAGTVMHLATSAEVAGGAYTSGLITKTTRAPIASEADNGKSNLRGTIAMAHGDTAASAAAQFFFNLVDNPELDHSDTEAGYTVFGSVTEGLDVLDQIGAVETTARAGFEALPINDVTIVAAERLDLGDGILRVRLTTSLGVIVVSLFDVEAPLTVADFLQYVDEGFYVGTIFHGVLPGALVQGGGFERGLIAKPPAGSALANSTDAGGARIRGSVTLPYTTDVTTATGEFAVLLADGGAADPATTAPLGVVFGHVVSGLDVLDQIAGVDTVTRSGLANVPADDVVIERIELRDVRTGETELNPAFQQIIDNDPNYVEYRTAYNLTIVRQMIIDIVLGAMLSLGG